MANPMNCLDLATKRGLRTRIEQTYNKNKAKYEQLLPGRLYADAERMDAQHLMLAAFETEAAIISNINRILETALFKEDTGDATEKRGAETLAGEEQPPALATVTSGNERAEPTGESAAKEGPKEDKGISETPHLQQITSVTEALRAFTALTDGTVVDTSVEGNRLFADSARKLVDLAFVDTEVSNAKARQEVLQILNAASLSPQQRAVFNEVFVTAFNTSPTKSLYAQVKGKERPWYSYAKAQGLINDITKPLLPKAFIEAERKNATAQATNTENSLARPATPPPPKKKAEEFSYNTEDVITDLNRALVAGDQGYLSDAAASYNHKDALIDKEALYLGAPLKNFFNQETGKVNTSYLKAMAAKASESGKTFRLDGKEITKPMDVLRVRGTVASILGKMKAAPKAHVYKNLVDLKQANPELYKRAAAGRPGDFDSISFSGYSFGKEIIILTDNIRTDQELKAVLAHETLGHFGLRSIMTDAELTTVLNDILRTDRRMIAKTAEKMVLYKMDRIEAAEEALSDLAATLENNTLMRIWNAIKGALNKLGITFGDELARYLVRQAGRYVKTGESTVFNVGVVQSNMRDLATEGVIGRFSQQPAASSGVVGAAVAADAGNAKQPVELKMLPKPLANAITGAADLQKNLRIARSSFTPPTSLKQAGGSARGLSRKLLSKAKEVLENIQTLDSVADLSTGIDKLYKLFQEQSAHTQRIISKYNSIMKNTLTAGYATTEQRLLAGKMAAYFSIYQREMSRGAMSSEAAKIGALGDISSKMFVFNSDNLDAATKLAKPDIEMFRRGFSAYITEELKMEGFKQLSLDLPAMPNLTENSKEWVIFSELLQVEQEKAKDILQSKYERFLELLKETDRKLRNIKTKTKTPLTQREVDFFYNLRDKYLDIITISVDNDGTIIRDQNGKIVRLDMPTAQSIKRGQDFVVEVQKALHSNEKVKDWKEGTQGEVAALYYNDPDFADIVNEIPHMASLGITQRHQIDYILPIFNDMAVSSRQIIDAEIKARRTITEGYIPLLRRGDWEVRIEAFDAKSGKPVSMMEGIKSTLPLFHAVDEEEAGIIAESLREAFEQDMQFYLPSDDDGVDSNGEPAKRAVKFRVVSNKKGKTPPLGHAIDYDDFLRAVLRLNIQMTPAEQVRVMKALTGQEEMVRRNMMRSGTVGWDPDIIQSVSIDTQSGAHIAAKNRYSYRTDEIMSNTDNWRGSREYLEQLEREWKAVDPAANPALAHIKKQIYTEYAFRYVHMAGKYAGDPDFVEINGKEIATKGLGEQYRDLGKKLLGFYSNSTNIMDSTEGFLTEQAGWLKNLAVLLQLGGNISSALTNFFSVVFNVIPYLGTFNPTRGYGGGFNLVAAAMEMSAALNNANDMVFNDAEKIREVIKQNTYTKYGLTYDEALFLLDQTESGNLIPALTNTLLQTARGGVKSNVQAQAEKVWMSAFTYTEQLTRRATALAAYRLYKQRTIMSGVPEAEFSAKSDTALHQSQAFKDVSHEAGKAVIKTNGDYNLYNRPEIFRGHFTQYIFMYKMIAVITVQMVAALPMKGKVYYLAAVLLLAGMKGVPFAEDLFDLIDTLIQQFKIPIGSIEAAITEILDGVAPGMGATAMTGVLNTMGLSFSSKIGMGDIVPASGIFRHGANIGNETGQLLGPVFSATVGLFSTGVQLAEWGASTVGIGDKTTSLADIMRNSPFAAVKGFADGLTYLNDGMITDAKGKVISTDVSPTVVIGRMLGFYPAEAAESNTVIRLGRYASDYAAAIKAKYRAKYVQAYVRKDYAKMNEISGMVRDWNKNAVGTEFYIRNFENGAMKAAKQAATPAAARYLKVAPESSKDMLQELIDIYGLEEGTD